MNRPNLRKSKFRRGLAAVSLLLGFGLQAGSAGAAGNLSPDADEILRSMSKFLAGTKAFSVSADMSTEIVTVEQQKLQFNGHAELVIERPSRLYATRQGRFADAELIYDGSRLTIHGKTAKAYIQQDLAGNVDKAVAAIESATGLSLPGADLLFSDPYAVLSSGVTSSGYYGLAYVGGVKAHHLAFRTAMVDWQIWVKDGDQPLPLKYVITSKRIAGAPAYSVVLSRWNLKPAIAAERFTFVAPQGAKRVPALAVDETGEFTTPEENK